MKTVELQVQGMSCGSCVKHVTEALRPLEGVSDVTVDLQAGRVKVSGDSDNHALLAVLQDAGYPARLATAGEHSESANLRLRREQWRLLL